MGEIGRDGTFPFGRNLWAKFHSHVASLITREARRPRKVRRACNDRDDQCGCIGLDRKTVRMQDPRKTAENLLREEVKVFLRKLGSKRKEAGYGHRSPIEVV